jgi:hypothetical protein
VKFNYLTAKLAAIITVICCGCICVFVPATAKTERVEQLPAISHVDRVSSTKNHVEFYDFKDELPQSEPRSTPPDSAARLRSLAKKESPSISAVYPDGSSRDNQPDPAPGGIRRDINGRGVVSIEDVVCLITYIFGGGPAPDPLLSGAVNCTDAISISDAVSLVNHIFAGGPEPCANCP